MDKIPGLPDIFQTPGMSTDFFSQISSSLQGKGVDLASLLPTTSNNKPLEAQKMADDYNNVYKNKAPVGVTSENLGNAAFTRAITSPSILGQAFKPEIVADIVSNAQQLASTFAQNPVEVAKAAFGVLVQFMQQFALKFQDKLNQAAIEFINMVAKFIQ